jgi:pyruvate dehydrogenase kinase 2/3/4
MYLDFGRTATAKDSYLYLRKELLVRLANIMQEIDLLPPKLLQMPSAKFPLIILDLILIFLARLVSEWYKQSFEELLPFEQADATFERIGM